MHGHREIVWRRRITGAVAIAAVAFVAGVVVGAGHTDHAITVARDYAKAFAHRNSAAMYALFSESARSETSQTEFTSLQQDAFALSTATAITPGKPVKESDQEVRVPLVVRTRIFGTVRADLELPLSGSGDKTGVDWTPNLTFPGVAASQTLRRETMLPPRATLLTRDGQILAEGPGRAPAAAVMDVAADTVGQTGAIPPARAAQLRALGVPAGAKVGISGLERALDDRLMGKPGGRLFAGGHLLASSLPRQARAVKTTIAPSVERAAVTALAGRLGGVVAFDPRNGQVLAFAGIAFSGLQPPGSTFKMVTLTGSLAAGIAHTSDTFPVQTQAMLDGVPLQNANGEYCGGSLAESFAKSCNSVFAPMGVRLGGAKLVKTAEDFGFDSPPDIPGAATSTLPPADQIGDDLALGSTAIGQGEVQATALQMATIAATIGLRGRKPRLTLALADHIDNLRARQVIDRRTAITAGRLMLDVVRYGTGTSAQISGVRVAGKTGTAELQTTKTCDVEAQDDPESCKADQQDDPTDTDAWFAAFAPAGEGRPRVAVGVMLVRAGAGGDTAAPVARQVLQAALARG